MDRTKKQFTKTISHQDVCAFVRRLRQGLQEGEDPEVMRRQVVAFWREHLEDYLSHEQAVLLPRLRSFRANMLSWNLQKEQRQIAHLMWYLWYPRSNCRAALAELADVLTTHIRFKEHDLLPFLKENLDETSFEHVRKPLYEDVGVHA